MANETIINLIEEKKYSQLKQFLISQNEVDLAGELEKIENTDDLIKVFRLLNKDLSAVVFSYLNADTQEMIINAITEKELSQITEELYLDDTIDLVESMPANIVSRILQSAKKEKRDEINKFLGYEDESAGSLMTTEYLDLKSTMTVEECFIKIKRQAEEKETISISYVLDSTRKLIGVISIRELFKAKNETLISEVMNPNVIFVETTTHEEEISLLFKKYDLTALPVVDHEMRMVGIITVDDIIDVIEDNTTEDFEKMAAMTPSENEYLKTSVVKHTKNRVIWLTILMFSAILTEMLISNFESLFAREIILISFLPFLMGTAGNSGSQSSTLMIRGLAIGEITMKDYTKIFFKEARISLFIGSILSTLNFFRVWLQYGKIELALTIGITIICVVFVANLIGFSMPLLAKKLKLDPAVMAGPLISTALDALVVLIFFSIASAILVL